MRFLPWDLHWPIRVAYRRGALEPPPILYVPVQSPSQPGTSSHRGNKSTSNSSSSPAPFRPHRNHEAICETQRPNILVPDTAELPAVIRGEFQPIHEVVVHSEFELLRIHRRQRVTRQLSREKLLVTRHQLRSPHLVLPEWQLAQLVRGLQPVAAAPF